MTTPKFEGLFLPTQLHDYEHWRQALGKHDMGFWDYLSVRADFELAGAFAKLFWPDFIEVEGYIFLAEHYSEATFRRWQEKTQDRGSIELVINEVHIYDLFMADKNTQVHPTLFAFLRRILADSWECALNSAFSDRQFDFHLGDEPDTYGPTLTFCQRLSI